MFNNFKVSDKVSFSLFGMYRGKNVGLQFEMEPMYFVNAGFRYNFLEDNRATFSLNFNNIFDTQEIAITGQRPFLQKANFMPEFSTIYTSLSYRFGGGKYRAKSRKQRDNDEKPIKEGKYRHVLLFFFIFMLMCCCLFSKIIFFYCACMCITTYSPISNNDY